MQRVFLFLSLWLGLFLSTAAAVPARLSYEPEANPKPPVRKELDLNGTAWQGKYITTIELVYIFEPDGTLSYRTATTGTIFRKRGTWKVEGNQLYFEVKPTTVKMLEFRGTITDPDTISGESLVVRTGQRSLINLRRTTPQFTK